MKMCSQGPKFGTDLFGELVPGSTNDIWSVTLKVLSPIPNLNTPLMPVLIVFPLTLYCTTVQWSLIEKCVH